MPSLDTYKRLKNGVKTVGDMHREQSNEVFEATWDSDISSCIGYFYDEDRDSEKELSDDLHPERSKTKIPIEVKFYEIEYNSLNKDQVGLHIVFKPSFDYKDVVPYYDKEYHNLLDSIFPVGLYCDLPDSKGVYHRFLVVGQYRHYSQQFPSYFVLPCDFRLRWVNEGQKYSCWGSLRSQNS